MRAVRGVKLAWQTVSGSDVVENFRVRVRHDFVLERVDDERPRLVSSNPLAIVPSVRHDVRNLSEKRQTGFLDARERRV